NNWPDDFPDEFKPDNSLPPDEKWNMNALANPFTASRLRRDFQGYTIWGRSGSGSQEDWGMIHRWDKLDTPQDHADYAINSGSPLFNDFGGYLGIGTDLPNASNNPDPALRGWQASPEEYAKFYRFDENYILVPNGSKFYGFPIYNPDLEWTPALQAQADAIEAANPHSTPDDISNVKVMQARLFKHSEMNVNVYDALADLKLIPLKGLAFPGGADADDPTPENLLSIKKERLARRYYVSSIMYPRKGVEYYVAATAYDRGIPSNVPPLNYLETGRDADANMKVIFPGSLAKGDSMDDIMVIPNPYIGRSKFDGRRENDKKGDKSRRLWFVNLPERCKIRIYTLAGDLVQELDHEGASNADIITISKAATTGTTADGIEPWDLLSKHNQIIAPGVYLFSVENKAGNEIKVGKFVIIK
ncbi:MAG: hypothetical protein RBS43_07335, partial [Candidatus Cloacimonas sp.]|nr:hypothetical protein [Candidatus Cloacimonas sp.]